MDKKLILVLLTLMILIISVSAVSAGFFNRLFTGELGTAINGDSDSKSSAGIPAITGYITYPMTGTNPDTLIASHTPDNVVLDVTSLPYTLVEGRGAYDYTQDYHVFVTKDNKLVFKIYKDGDQETGIFQIYKFDTPGMTIEGKPVKEIYIINDFSILWTGKAAKFGALINPDDLYLCTTTLDCTKGNPGYVTNSLRYIVNTEPSPLTLKGPTPILPGIYPNIYLQFDQTADTQGYIKDTAGNYKAKLMGGAKIGWGTEFKLTGGLDLDGISNYVQTNLNIDQSGIFPFITIMEAWVKPAEITKFQQIISSENGVYDWSLIIRDGNWKIFTGNKQVDTGITADANAWQHVAVVFTPGIGIKFYKNGILKKTISNPDIDYDFIGNDIFIGKNPLGGEYFKGKIDEVAIYQLPAISITSDEIKEVISSHYAKGEQGKTYFEGEQPIYPDTSFSYWTFDESEEGDMFAIDSNNNYMAKLMGDAHWISAVPKSGDDVNKANLPFSSITNGITFDGVGDYIQTNLNIDQSAESPGVTMEAWVRPASGTTVNQIISSESLYYDWGLMIVYDKWKVYTGNDIGYGAVDTGFTVDLDTWQHVAVVFIPGIGIKFYKNGVEKFVLEPALIGYDSLDNQIVIGKNALGGEYFKGQIDEIAVWNKPLDADTIKSHYNNGISKSYITPTPTVTTPTSITIGTIPIVTIPITYVTPVCGNNLTEGTEQCDGTDLAGKTCVSLGYTAGTLSCKPVLCTFDTSLCTGPTSITIGTIPIVTIPIPLAEKVCTTNADCNIANHEICLKQSGAIEGVCVVVELPIAGVCATGCETDIAGKTRCVPFGTRVPDWFFASRTGFLPGPGGNYIAPAYCGLDTEWHEQTPTERDCLDDFESEAITEPEYKDCIDLAEEASCGNNFECRSNACSEERCVSLEELKEEMGAFKRFICNALDILGLAPTGTGQLCAGLVS